MIQDSRFKIVCTYLLVAGIFFVLGADAQAGRLYISPSTSKVGIDEELKLDVRLDTQGDDINAIDISISYPVDLLEFISSTDAGSLVNIWIEKANPVNSVIRMAGLAPGGFVGDSTVTQLLFKPLKNGEALLSFDDSSQVLANGPDGKKVFVVFNGSRLFISNYSEVVKVEEIPAVNPIAPDAFNIYVDRDEDAFDKKWFVAFSAQDNASGISHYEIMEKTLGIFNGTWTRVEISPYVLKNQSLLSSIHIRAVNSDGQTREVAVFPQNLKVFYGSIVGMFLIITLLLILRVVLKKF